MCEVTYNKKDTASVFCLEKKSDNNSKMQLVLFKFSNPSIKTNIIRNAFKLKDNIYSISINRTREERNAFKKLLKEKERLNKKDMLGEWMYIIRGPPWDLKILKLKANKNSAICHQELRSDIDHLIEWSNEWQLKFSTSKCKAMQSGPTITSSYSMLDLNDHKNKEL